MPSDFTSSACWLSLDVRQRQFLLVASELEHARSPFDVGVLQWRKVGAMCALDGDESDEMVQSLSKLDLVRVEDVERRTMSLVSGRSLVQQVIDARTTELGHWLHAPHQ
jgi:hypothetical protein